MSGPTRFYDDLAEDYDLIYDDWEGAMLRHGNAISGELERSLPNRSPSSVRVLDVAAGIGTQALPLAALGYRIVARDISAAAIARLSREAAARRLNIDAAPGDMRTIRSSVTGGFDAVIAFDNAIPHLLDDSQVLDALRQFRALLQPGGLLLCSIRDYEAIDRSPESFHPYGERKRGGRTFRLGQSWRWLDTNHYRTELTIEELRGDVWRSILATDVVYYAIRLNHLLALMREAGFEAAQLVEAPFFQPVLTGRVIE